jgi:hypothetical protein
MEAADFGTLHSIHQVYLLALVPLLNKVLPAVRVRVEGVRVHVQVEGVRVRVEGVHLVPMNEVAAEGGRYRTVPVDA